MSEQLCFGDIFSIVQGNNFFWRGGGDESSIRQLLNLYKNSPLKTFLQLLLFTVHSKRSLMDYIIN